jgi:Tol biopolymer transport system component
MTDGRARTLVSALTVAAVLVVGGSPARSSSAFCGWTERVNVSTSGGEANGETFRGPISASGRFVAFSSRATNLVNGDTNGVEDVFLRDRLLDQTTRVSVSSDEEEANGASYLPLVSADGRLVAFRSVATNLAPGHGVEGFFVHDRLTGLTLRIPLGPTGQNPERPRTRSRREVCDRWCVNAVDANGGAFVLTSSSRLVRSDRNGVRDVFVNVRGRTIRVTVGGHGDPNGPSEGSSISADGTVVAFRSFASNLVSGDTNGLPDVFVRDLRRGVTQRVNVSTSGEQANHETFRPIVSADGRYVGFRSRASNLVRGDTNHALDVFVHDRATGVTTRISVSSEGRQASSYGVGGQVRRTLFMSRPFLSRHGRYAAFTSRAPNLVPGDHNGRADVFVHDLETAQTVRASVPDSGGEAISDSRVTGISADGHVVGFMSMASNLVSADTNGLRDYFVRVLTC